jgi:hypothetical protein
VASDGRGGISYFAGGFQNQYGLETQVVAAMCKLLLSFFFTKRNIQVTELISRWYSVFLCYLSRGESAKDWRPKISANRRFSMGGCLVHRLQFSAKHLPPQERWLPILAPPVHVTVVSLGSA